MGDLLGILALPLILGAILVWCAWCAWCDLD